MSDQQKILIKNEIKVLKGKHNINIYILAGILLLSFVGLGHSVGGLKYLAKRMDNPFTKWVNLTIPADQENQDKSLELQKYFESQTVRDSFLLDTIRGYKRDAYKFGFWEGKQSQFKRTRTIDPEEQLLKEILKPSNVLFSRIEQEISDMDPCWMIIKSEALKDLEYNLDFDKITHLELRNTWNYGFDRSFSIYLPVIAIVKDLPDHADIILTEHMDALLDSEYSEYQYIDVSETNIWTFISKNELEKQDIQEILSDSLGIADLDTEALELNGTEYWLHKVYLDVPADVNTKFDLFDQLAKKYEIKPYHDYTCNIGPTLHTENAQYLAFNFLDLKPVRKFRDKVKAEFGFEISLNQVEDKENFSLVTRLTILLAGILFIVSLTGVLIFIVNLLIAHFDKIQSNLGTFKAFGLSDKKLTDDYSKITLLFFTQALIIALTGTFAYWGIMVLFNGKFSLWHWSFVAVIISIVLLMYIFITQIIKKKLSKTPGDLIYNR